MSEGQVLVGATQTEPKHSANKQSELVLHTVPIAPSDSLRRALLKHIELVSPRTPTKPSIQLEHVCGVAAHASLFRAAQKVVLALLQLTLLTVVATFPISWLIVFTSPTLSKLSSWSVTYCSISRSAFSRTVTAVDLVAHAAKLS